MYQHALGLLHSGDAKPAEDLFSTLLEHSFMVEVMFELIANLLHF